MTSSEALHPRTVEVVTALEAAQQDMHDILAAIPAAHHTTVPPNGGWSVAQVVEHLALLEDGVGRLISKMIKEVEGVDETSTEPIAPTIERFQVWNPTRRIIAPESVAPGGDVSLADALDRQSIARGRMIEALVRASGRALGTVSAPHPVLGPLNGYQWGLIIAQHQRRHLLQIATVSSSLSS
ncbi:DinB family protein [Gemmatimonas aurantiaca]|uniref:DinB family protein n=1 Tax=Gemmatimonas aurantiaca TaxID=173480 RepID=UPI00301DF0EE